MTGRVIIVGAGLAGLAAALSLSGAGRQVTVIEASRRAGGRCRSYHDPVLDREIDNGNHLMMTANDAVFAYLDEIGARDRVSVTAPARFPFFDVRTGERWTVRPNAGPVPWWVLSRSRNVAGARLRDYADGLRVLRAGPQDTVADCVRPGTVLYQRFWEPLSIGVLNIEPSAGAATILATTCRLTFAKGEAAARPVIVRRSLGHALIDPALSTLQARGVDLRFQERVRGLKVAPDGRVLALETTRERLPLGPDDHLILAVPPWNMGELLPDLDLPRGTRMILNLHFAPTFDLTGQPLLTGLTGSIAQWLFVRDGLASVTVSAADAFADTPAAEISARIWPEIAAALGHPDSPEPPCRVVKEKRATFAETPDNEPRRPGPRSPFPNVALAGDWTVRGFPATIEGAILSGRRAAEQVRR